MHRHGADYFHKSHWIFSPKIRSQEFVSTQSTSSDRFNLIDHLPGDGLEAIRKFSNVSKSDNNILSQIRLLGSHALYHNLDNQCHVVSVFMVNNLFLAVQVDRATH